MEPALCLIHDYQTHKSWNYVQFMLLNFVLCYFKFFWSDLWSDHVDSISIMLELWSFRQSYLFRCSADRIMIELWSNYVFGWSSDFALWWNYDWIMFSSSESCFFLVHWIWIMIQLYNSNLTYSINSVLGCFTFVSKLPVSTLKRLCAPLHRPPYR